MFYAITTRINKVLTTAAAKKAPELNKAPNFYGETKLQISLDLRFSSQEITGRMKTLPSSSGANLTQCCPLSFDTAVGWILRSYSLTMDALLAVELIVTLITCIISDKVSRVKKLLKISGFLPQRLNRVWHCNSIRKELNLRNASPSLFNIGIIVLGYRDGNEFGLKYYLTEPHSACLKGSRLAIQAATSLVQNMI